MRLVVAGFPSRGIPKFTGTALRLSKPDPRVIFPTVHLTKYYPPSRRLQLDFAARVARKENPNMELGGFEKEPVDSIFKNGRTLPNSVAECWQISCEIREKELRERKESGSL